MGILSNNTYTNGIRKTFGDFTVFQPTTKQKNEIRNILEENSQKVLDGIEGVQEDFLNSEITRKIMVMCTNIKKEELDIMSDEELQEIIDNGNMNLKELMVELKHIVQEINFEIQVSVETKIDEALTILNSFKSVSKVEKMADKLGVDLETLISAGNGNQEALAKIQEAQSNKTKKKNGSKKSTSKSKKNG